MSIIFDKKYIMEQLKLAKNYEFSEKQTLSNILSQIMFVKLIGERRRMGDQNCIPRKKVKVHYDFYII